MAPRYRLCPKCKYRYERVKQKCPNCAAARPKKRVPKHAETLRDDPYEVYLAFAKKVHGAKDDSCNICGRPRGEINHHRDHGHNKSEPTYGKPRGILCYRCNNLLPRQITAEWITKAAKYLNEAHEHYTKPEEMCHTKDSATSAPSQPGS